MPSFKNRSMIRGLPYLSFCIPALVFYIGFYIYPAVSGFYYSLTDWTTMKNGINFIGLKNFMTAFQDISLLNSVLVTLKYTFLITILQNAAGLVFALAVDSLKWNKFYRIIIFLPYILPTVVSSNIWVYIYNPINGLLSLISKSAGLGELNILGDPKTALLGVISTNLWQLVGFSLIIYFAALQSVPHEILESSRVDGAGAMRQIFHIKIPLILPAVTINVMFSLINGLKVFDYIYIMTNGGPGSATRSISAMVFFVAFNEGMMGYGSAVGVLLFISIALISYFALKIMRRREVEAL